jgi:two-component system chemotaxis response regulator CheB
MPPDSSSASPPIRVLVVDDAVAVRRLLTMIIQDDPDLELVGIAADGRIALNKIELLKPDIVTLDILMPEMDGLTVLAEMNKRGLTVPTLVFSTVTHHGAKETIEALALGATDYITKPTQYDNPADALEAVRRDMVPRIKAIVRGERIAPSGGAGGASTNGTTPAIAVDKAASAGRVDILAIGSSTGGPNALAAVLSGLPKSFKVPVVIAQHMPPVYTTYLAQRLDTLSPLTVREAVDGEVLEAGSVYIAPGDHHLTVQRSATGSSATLTQGPPVNHCRPSVDVLFTSVAEVYGKNSLAVVLTGMGHDGRDGCGLIRRQGGQVFVQDQASSVVWGMPGAVHDAGYADQVVALDDIAGAVVRATALAGGFRRATT